MAKDKAKVDKKKENNNKKKRLIITFLVIGIIIVVITIFLIVTITNNKRKKYDIDYNIIENTLDYMNDNNIEKVIDNTDNKRIGNNEYGYITIPNSWHRFYEVEGDPMVQYTNNIWTICIFSKYVTQESAINYSESCFNTMKSEGAVNINKETVKIGDYTAYKVYGYYENQEMWQTIWCFEANDEKAHYICIKGPDKDSEYLNIVNTFSVNE